jgi:hypothetical protein
MPPSSAASIGNTGEMARVGAAVTYVFASMVSQRSPGIGGVLGEIDRGPIAIVWG